MTEITKKYKTKYFKTKLEYKFGYYQGWTY